MAVTNPKPITRVIKLAEFKTRLMKDLEHFKRFKLWEEGHIDIEIAVCRGVQRETIGDWRKEHNLPANKVLQGKSYKHQISARKKLGRNK